MALSNCPCLANEIAMLVKSSQLACEICYCIRLNIFILRYASGSTTFWPYYDVILSSKEQKSCRQFVILNTKAKRTPFREFKNAWLQRVYRWRHLLASLSCKVVFAGKICAHESAREIGDLIVLPEWSVRLETSANVIISIKSTGSKLVGNQNLRLIKTFCCKDP